MMNELCGLGNNEKHNQLPYGIGCAVSLENSSLRIGHKCCSNSVDQVASQENMDM